VSEPTEQPRENFEQLFRDTCTDLLAYILRRSRNAEDAADVPTADCQGSQGEPREGEENAI